MNKNILGLIVIAIIAIFGGYFYPQGKTIFQKNIGAVATNEIVGLDDFTFNGVRHVYRSCDWSPATTTPCKIAIPTGTSTLVFLGNSISTATATAMVFDVATSTTGFATSTYPLMKNVTVAGGAKNDVFFATTTGTLAGNDVWSATGQPGNVSFTTNNNGGASASNYIIVKTGVGLGGYTVGARMKAEFIMLGQ